MLSSVHSAGGAGKGRNSPSCDSIPHFDAVGARTPAVRSAPSRLAPAKLVLYRFTLRMTVPARLASLKSAREHSGPKMELLKLAPRALMPLSTSLLRSMLEKSHPSTLT